MKRTIHNKQIFTETMIQSVVQEILLFWKTELKKTINIMDIQDISKNIKKKVKQKFKSCLHYLEKKNILHYIDMNKDTYYAFIILFTLYSRCIYKHSKNIYINDKKIFMFMDIGLKKYNIKINHLDNSVSSIHSILLPFQVTEEHLHQRQGREIMYKILFATTNIYIKNILRKVIHFQKKRIEILDRFQHFPNRNKILKRDYTIEEIDFLDEIEYSNLKLIF